jgi:YVTN family beta-propeller protein
MVFNARPPFEVLKSIDTGPITNHVNIVRNARGRFAYVTVGGLDRVLVFRTDTFEQVARIDVGELPHGIWPSGDGTRVYVGIENGNAMTAIDTIANKVVATIPIGQAAQAVVFVPNAVRTGSGTANLQPLGVAGQSIRLSLGPPGGAAVTHVALFDQGLTQILQAAVAGLDAKTPYVLALSGDAKGARPLEALASFTTNSAGAAIVNAVGPIRQVVQASAPVRKRYLVISRGTAAEIGSIVQIQQ